ncbi:MAG: phosphatidate cytidylyltransferase [Caldilineales bacterium]|nr:phosphatidate cytidylyltransferase [Caldilineales bacterium]
MLRQRVISAAIMAPIVLVGAWLGGWWFTALIAVIASLATWEVYGLLARTNRKPMTYVGLAAVALIIVEGNLPADPQRLQILLVVFVLACLTLGLFWRSDFPASDLTLTIGAAIYVGMTLRFVPLLRNMPDGLGWIALTALVVWITDSGAYFIGRRFGKHKFAPRISPKKTWEGFIGGLLVGTLSAVLLALWLAPGLAWYYSLAVGLVVGLVGPLGDLSESLFKRQVSIKDSSNLIPGHGGVFDRIDSFFFVAPSIYILILVLGLN